MAEHTEKEWKTYLGVLTHEYGEDRAQEAILRILEDTAKGIDIYNPIVYGRTYCMWRIRDERRKQQGLKRVPFEILRRREMEGLSQPDTLRNNRDPFNQVAAREILESLPQILVDQVLEYEESGDGWDKTLSKNISNVRKKLRAYAE